MNQTLNTVANRAYLMRTGALAALTIVAIIPVQILFFMVFLPRENIAGLFVDTTGRLFRLSKKFEIGS